MSEQFGSVAHREAWFDVDRIVSELSNLRRTSQSSRYGAGRIPELPSQQTVVEIIADLTTVLYPRHFGPGALTPSATDSYLALALGYAAAHIERADPT